MKIISWNINGFRATLKKGGLDWFEKGHFDILCLQETKVQPEQFQLLFNLSKLRAYHPFFHSASKKGYSGVAVCAREKPLKVTKTLGLKKFDREGRFLKLDFPEFSLLNFYLPHGGRDKMKLNYKIATYNHLFKYLNKVKNQKMLLIGDFNIAHQPIDLARPKQNNNNIMFTPKERKQISGLLALGFTDTFRKLHQEGDHYTWWNYAHSARERNIGWRIDYAFTSKSLTPYLKNAFVFPKIKGSDHCPIGVEIKID